MVSGAVCDNEGRFELKGIPPGIYYVSYSLIIDYDVILKIYANTGSATNIGSEILFSQQIFEIWKLSGNINYFKNHIDSYQGELLFPFPHTFKIDDSNENTWDIKINNQVDLPHQFQFQLTIVYFAPRNIPQGRQLSRSSVDPGIKKSLIQKQTGYLSFCG